MHMEIIVFKTFLYMFKDSVSALQEKVKILFAGCDGCLFISALQLFNCFKVFGKLKR